MLRDCGTHPDGCFSPRLLQLVVDRLLEGVAMKLIRSSEFHRVELVVPVIKDLDYLGAFQEGSMDELDPVKRLVMSADDPSEARNLGQLLKSVDDDCFRTLVGNTGNVTAGVHEVLRLITGAVDELDQRLEFSSSQLIKDEFDGGVEFFLSTNETCAITPLLKEWNDICRQRRETESASTDKIPPLPEELSTHHIGQVLLHSRTAWHILEESFKDAGAVRFLSTSNLSKGKYTDGKIDYSIIYTLFTTRPWAGNFPIEIANALLPFCQRAFFVTEDGVPNYYKV